MENKSNTLLALLAGLTAGAILGILLAPDKGSATRDSLSDSLNKLGGSIMDTASQEIEKLTGMKEKFVDNIKNKISGEIQQDEGD